MGTELKNFALIIGAMKCATTSLFYYLSEHPEISACSHKETQFFNTDQKLAQGIEWYRSLWKTSRPTETIALEASPTYTQIPFQPNVAERIAHFAKEEKLEFRFIYIIRHPFDRIESHITHQLSERGNTESNREIDEENIAFTQYARQLDPYVKHFGRDRILILTLNELTQNTQEVLKRVCRFLEIDPSFIFQSVDVVRNSRDTLNLHPLVKRMSQVQWIGKLVRRIPPAVRQYLRKPLARQDRLDVSLNEDEKSYVLNRLRSDLTRLKTEYSVDIEKHWGFSIHSLNAQNPFTHSQKHC
jgi:hypothetical protein